MQSSEQEPALRPKEILVQARHLLLKPQSWSQGAFAYNEGDHRVSHNDASACSWCLEGAIRRVAKRGRALEIHIERALLLVRAIIHVPGNYPTIQGWNDRETTRHSDVLAVLDKAIATTS